MSEKSEMSTGLVVPIELKKRIEGQAGTDRRTYKQEIIVLLFEAVAKREANEDL